MPRHQCDDGFIGIDVADACAENEEAKREGRGDDEGREEDAQPARTILTRGPLRSQRGENTHPFGG